MNDQFDPFDPASLRLDQTFTDGTAVRKLLTKVPARKPARQDFAKVVPAPDYGLWPIGLIEMKDEREHYLVTPAIAPDLVGEMAVFSIFTAINRQAVVHLWPVRIAGADGKLMTWHRSAADA